MSEELGISRSLLREKMRYLEANGLIDTIQGSGRFAKLPSLSDQINSVWSVVLKVNPAKLLELLDVRILLEINTLQNAVDRITDEQLQHLAETVARMKFLAKREIYGGGERNSDEIVKKVDAVTADDVQAVANELIDHENVSVSVVGKVRDESFYTGYFS